MIQLHDLMKNKDYLSNILKNNIEKSTLTTRAMLSNIKSIIGF